MVPDFSYQIGILFPSVEYKFGSKKEKRNGIEYTYILCMFRGSDGSTRPGETDEEISYMNILFYILKIIVLFSKYPTRFYYNTEFEVDYIQNPQFE